MTTNRKLAHAERDRHPETNQFLTGNSAAAGRGRPPGSRNKLGEAFLLALKADFDKHGAEAIRICRETDPAAYIKVIAKLVSKLDVLEADPDKIALEDLTDDELDSLTVEIHRLLGEQLDDRRAERRQRRIGKVTRH